MFSPSLVLELWNRGTCGTSHWESHCYREIRGCSCAFPRHRQGDPPEYLSHRMSAGWVDEDGIKMELLQISLCALLLAPLLRAPLSQSLSGSKKTKQKQKIKQRNKQTNYRTGAGLLGKQVKRSRVVQPGEEKMCGKRGIAKWNKIKIKINKI